MNWQETKQQLEKYGIKNLPDEWQWRIDLSGANLSGANLSRANLICADLSGANLRGANLHDANLSDANLSSADLYGAYLRGADLSGANLRDAYLSGANLRGANLHDANLSSADLYGADLSGANLSGANLSSADLYGADLPVYQKWFVTWQTNGIIKIGCKEKTVAEWDVWFASDETYETERNTADFERIEAAYQHAKRMVEIYQKYEVDNVDNQQ